MSEPSESKKKVSPSASLRRVGLSQEEAERCMKLASLSEAQYRDLQRRMKRACDDILVPTFDLDKFQDEFLDGAAGTARKRGQRGRSKATAELIDAAIEILEQQQPMTVRGVAYQLFNMKLIPSMGRNDTNRVSRVLVSAREAGLIDWDWIVDESGQLERPHQWDDIEEYSEMVIKSYRKDFWAYQPYNIIVMSEKATVGGVIRPVTDEWGVSFLAVHGFSSATKMHELAEQSAADERETIILYVGDYDPSGLWMSEVDVPARMEKYGGEFALRRIALLGGDITDPSLAFEVEQKREDPRYAWYKKNFGRQCYELDAMPPNDLRQRIEDAIGQYVDPVAWERHQLAERAEVETIKKVCRKMVA